MYVYLSRVYSPASRRHVHVRRSRSPFRTATTISSAIYRAAISPAPATVGIIVCCRPPFVVARRSSSGAVIDGSNAAAAAAVLAELDDDRRWRASLRSLRCRYNHVAERWSSRLVGGVGLVGSSADRDVGARSRTVRTSSRDDGNMVVIVYRTPKCCVHDTESMV